ncbi:hypothetical protein FACS1894200_07900 [Spirochaetia bacterium]|nr:hypothetical protein FACS1894200_07900 [Spirochaetia bacterium]
MKDTTIVNIGRDNNAPIAVAMDNSTVTNASTICSDITDDFVIRKLNEKGISPIQIEAIRPLIAEIVAEYNKQSPQKDNFYKVFSKIKEIGGAILVRAFDFLSKPEAVAVIDNLKQIAFR